MTRTRLADLRYRAAVTFRFDVSLIATLLTVAGCSSHSQGGEHTGSASSPAAAPVPASAPAPAGAPAPAAKPTASAPAAAAMSAAAAEAKAREILQHQIDATKAHDDSVQKTFTADAIIFTHDKSTTADSVTSFGLADAGPDGVQTDKATISKVLAGGNADAVWFYAEVATETSGPDGKGKSTTRVVEVASAADQWRVVAASFGIAAALAPAGDNREIAGATSSDGPLAKLLGSPSAVADQLAPDAIVIGPTAAASGAAAKAALASWNLQPLSLYQRAREIRTASWGFAQANLDHPDKKYIDRLAGLIVALPSTDGHWRVVLAQYVGQ